MLAYHLFPRLLEKGLTKFCAQDLKFTALSALNVLFTKDVISVLEDNPERNSNSD